MKSTLVHNILFLKVLQEIKYIHCIQCKFLSQENMHMHEATVLLSLYSSGGQLFTNQL